MILANTPNLLLPEYESSEDTFNESLINHEFGQEVNPNSNLYNEGSFENIHSNAFKYHHLSNANDAAVLENNQFHGDPYYPNAEVVPADPNSGRNYFNPYQSLSRQHSDPQPSSSTNSGQMVGFNEAAQENPKSENQSSPSMDPPTPQSQYLIKPPVLNTQTSVNSEFPNQSPVLDTFQGSNPSYFHQHQLSNTSNVSNNPIKSNLSFLSRQPGNTNYSEELKPSFHQRQSSVPYHFEQYAYHTSTTSITGQQSPVVGSLQQLPNQYQPPPKHVKPRIATTVWDDENTICYQVEAHGILVSRRQDTNFVNGTKLLNLAGMSRGKRDGILKSEKVKTVIKMGTMNLKGVWIPFERASEIARNEGLDELLFPLFVKDLKGYFEKRGSSLKNDGIPPPGDYAEFDS
ncbi:hypothetical protein CLIB1444_12S02498 [[Candida] jaroonii]|uniref:Uncharacterized protein n=1 Tax=[Candida] jaroonii TaxID=467808 RepID=A0ACA9YD88_9ASCO|nr:hypothetical protein CLIB1444_12S02498 [[Candida] jaroonii]